MNQQAAIDIVSKAIDAVNELRPPQDHVPKDLDCVLFGKDGLLDSLAMTTFILFIEARIEESFGLQVDLLGDQALDGSMADLRTPAAFVGLIVERTAG